MPETVRMLKPFAEALAFHRKRSTLTRENFYSLVPDARPRAFTITGLQKYSSLLEANRLAEAAIANGLTKSDFADSLGALVDNHGGTILSPQRLELIHQNAIATSTSAGRYQQLTDPDILADRPYWQYPLGPNDGKTSRICKELQGLTARHDDPIWEHIFPPNHHNERHLTVLSLASEDVEGKDVYESAGEKTYPFVDGREILPDPGFDFRPGSVMSADDHAFVRAAEELGSAVPRKVASDYGLSALTELPIETLPLSPGLARGADATWDSFRNAVGIAEGDARTILLDYAGDGVWVTRDTFEHLIDESKGADRARQFAFLVPTLTNPAEVWYVPRTRADGTVVYSKRYIGMFREGEGKKRATVVFLERSPEGWLMRSGRVQKERALEELRAGLLVFTTAGKS